MTDKHKDFPELLSRARAAKMLDVAKSTVWRWAADGVFPEYHIESKAYYKKSEILKALKKTYDR